VVDYKIAWIYQKRDFCLENTKKNAPNGIGNNENSRSGWNGLNNSCSLLKFLNCFSLLL